MTEQLRVPPHSIEAEQAVLGGLMLRPESLAQIADWLSEGDFYRRDHQLIYRAIVSLAAADKPFDAVTLGEWFGAEGIADVIDGPRYMIELASNTPSAANIVAWAEIVRERARLREVIDVGTELAGAAFEPRGAGSADLVAHCTQRLATLGADARAAGLRPVRADLGTWVGELQQRFTNGARMTGVVTPWHDVNEATRGWQPGELIVVAGRTSMGKSVLGVQAAVFASLRGIRTALFSVEMRRQQVVQRAVACIGQVPHEALRAPADMRDEHWPRVTEATAQLRDALLLVDDQAGVTAHQIAVRCKREHLRAPLGLVVVDHLHELKVPGKDRVNELGDAARVLKAIAKDLNVPVIVLGQLNRANTQRTDHRPTLADLRASGAIEEVADVVLLLHREDYYERDTHLKGVVEVIVGKGRDLPAGATIHLRNRYDEMRLEDWEGPLPQAPEREQRRTRGFGGNAGADKAAA